VREEIRLASYQAVERDRRLQMAEYRTAAKHRLLETLVHEKVDKFGKEDRDWRIGARKRRSSKLLYLEYSCEF